MLDPWELVILEGDFGTSLLYISFFLSWLLRGKQAFPTTCSAELFWVATGPKQQGKQLWTNPPKP